MQWYIYSILAMLSFSVMMLMVRKVREMGFSSMQSNIFLFGVVFLGFSVMAGNSLNEVYNAAGFREGIILLFIASLCAIAANYADFKAVGLSPNPGYSQAIKNSNILTITLLSAFIFNLPMSTMKMAGIAITITGISTLVLKSGINVGNPKKEPSDDYPWYAYSFATVIFFTVMVLILKQLTIVGFSSLEINFFLFGFSFFGFVALGWKEAKAVFGNAKSKKFLKIILIASLFSLIGNIMDVEAIRLAPNPGFAQAIKNANILVITFFSARYMFSELTISGIAGTAMIFIGIIFIIL